MSDARLIVRGACNDGDHLTINGINTSEPFFSCKEPEVVNRTIEITKVMPIKTVTAKEPVVIPPIQEPSDWPIWAGALAGVVMLAYVTHRVRKRKRRTDVYHHKG